MEGDVDCAELGRLAGALLDQPPQPLRERDAACLDADECDLLEVGVSLDDLVRDPRQRPRDRICIEEDLPGSLHRGVGVQRHSGDSFPASLDRVKGVRVRATLSGRPDGVDQTGAKAAQKAA